MLGINRRRRSGRPTASALIFLLIAATVLAVVPAPALAQTVTDASATPVASFDVLPGPSAAANAGEPTIGINWNTGNALMMVSARTFRVTFNGTGAGSASWADVSSPFSVTNLDPILYEDPATGITLAGGDDGACDILSLTTTDGQSWLPAGNACPGTVDHPSVAVGPPGPNAVVPSAAAGSPARILYACQQESVDACAVSHDGGHTFVSTPLTCGYKNPGTFGHIRFDAKGRAYVPMDQCSVNGQGVAISANDGLTWTAGNVGIPSGSPGGDPSVAAGAGDTVPGGQLYFATVDPSSSHPLVTTSTNHGKGWTSAVDLATSSAANSGDAVGVQATAFPTVIAGDDARAAVSFLGTKDPGNAYASGFTGSWDLYVAFTTDGGQHWSSVDVTPNDPVQRGLICMGGTFGCGSGGRNLLDFMDSTVDANGYVLVGFADGCTGACAGSSGTAAESTSALATMARETTGPCLFAAKCAAGPQNGTTLAPPAPLLPQVLPAVDTCDPNIVVFSSDGVSGVANGPGFNAHAAPCTAEGVTGPGPVDTAILDPGANQVSVRYLQNLGTGASVVVQGLGANATPVAMTCTPGNTYCDAPAVAIDPTQMGSLTATVFLNGNPIGSVTYHTLGS